MRNYCAYIDEFGNTGDAVKYNPNHPFGDQPIFCLSAVILEENDSSINDFLDTIRPNANEIKSKNMYPRWIPEAKRIFEKISCAKYKTQIELVDKKYQVCSFIVNQFVFPPQERGEANIDDWKVLAKLFNEKLYSELDDDVFSEYNELAKDCTPNKIQLFFDLLKKQVMKFNADDASDYMLDAVKETEDSFHNRMFSFQKPEHLFQKDVANSGNELYLVPNLLAFTNIYCRLCSLPMPVAIIHDKQSQFIPIMQKHKNFLVEHANLLPQIRGAGWNPSDIKDLPFYSDDSKSTRFIQIADIISGFIGRIHLKHIKGETLSQDEKDIIYFVREGMLLNYVGPQKYGEIWIG